MAFSLLIGRLGEDELPSEKRKELQKITYFSEALNNYLALVRL